MALRDKVVGITGAVVVVVAVLGVIVIEGRSGPFHHEVVPEFMDGIVSGSLVTRGAVEGVNVLDECVPTDGSETCSPASFRIELIVEGATALGHAMVPVAFLRTAQGSSKLGTFAEDAGRLRLSIETDDPLGDATGLVVSMEADPERSTPGPLWIYERSFDEGEDRDVTFDGLLAPPLANAEGRLVLNQIGAVSVSATARFHAEGLPLVPGFVYRTWFVAHDDGAPAYVYLDDVEGQGDPMTGSTSSRVERVRLSDQDRFLVTLEPVGAEAKAPTGIALLGADLRAT